MLEEKLGFKMRYFIPIVVIVLIATYLDFLPKGMIGALLFMMVVGIVLDFIGESIPIVNSYFGGGPILTIFGTAALVYYNVFPKDIFDNITAFMKGGGFLDFYIAALIVGSILGMNRKLLIKAALKYLPVIIGGVAVSLLLTGTVGYILGYGFKKALFYIAIPIMGGGMGAGAVPLSQIFGLALKEDPTKLLAVMVPAVALGNAMAIVAGSAMNKIGKKFPKLSGEGKLLKGLDVETDYEEKEKKEIKFEDFGKGLTIALTFFVLGTILSKFIAIHAYALMIISVIIAKILNLVDEKYERFAAEWFNFMAKNFTIPLLVGIGVAYTNLQQVIDSFSWTYLILVFATVFGAIIGTGIVGALLNFYVVEATITAGLCMANMGGTGDVAVLTSAKRIELMPFSQISSRIGGAFMLLLTSFLVNML